MYKNKKTKKGYYQYFKNIKKIIYFRLWQIKEKSNKFLKNENGQGTTEYAILVGVLVVIAILAIAIFRPKLEELWNAIAEGINGL